MKFEIPFNTENECQEKLFLWKYMWTNRIRKTWYYMLIVLVCVLLLLLVSKTGVVYVLLLASCMGLVISYIRSLVMIERHKRKYLQSIRNRSQALKGTSLVFEFTEEHFMYEDQRLGYKIKWSEFQSMTSSPAISLLKLKNQEGYYFVISKQEFGEDNYPGIVAFLEAKMPRQSF